MQNFKISVLYMPQNVKKNKSDWVFGVSTNNQWVFSCSSIHIPMLCPFRYPRRLGFRVYQGFILLSVIMKTRRLAIHVSQTNIYDSWISKVSSVWLRLQRLVWWVFGGVYSKEKMGDMDKLVKFVLITSVLKFML